MRDKKLEWADIAYFSKGAISVSDGIPLTININKDLDPADFVGELLAAGTKAELTLNATAQPEERASNFPGLVETQPVLDTDQNRYVKTVSYTFSRNVILSMEEVEG